MSALSSTTMSEESPLTTVTANEESPAIPWDVWLQNLESATVDNSEWLRAEAFAASVLAVAERKRRSSEDEARFYRALAALAPHSDLVCYFEMQELADWDARDFVPEHVSRVAAEIEALITEFASWGQRVASGHTTAREDAAAAGKIRSAFQRARAFRGGREILPTTEMDTDGVIRCHSCGSSDVRCSTPQTLWDRILLKALDLDTVRCRSCRRRFHARVEARRDCGSEKWGSADGMAQYS
jgi:hypothetical protein